MNEKLIEELKALPDRLLFCTIQQALEGRKFEYSEAADEHGHATDTAKLAVIKKITE